jgi:hypothetical protein
VAQVWVHNIWVFVADADDGFYWADAGGGTFRATSAFVWFDVGFMQGASSIKQFNIGLMAYAPIAIFLFSETATMPLGFCDICCIPTCCCRMKGRKVPPPGAAPTAPTAPACFVTLVLIPP